MLSLNISSIDNIILVGLGSRARVGKDYGAAHLVKTFRARGVNTFKTSFGAAVKEDLDSALLAGCKCSGHTEEPAYKAIIRPVLVAYAKAARMVNPLHWVDRWRRSPAVISAITGARRGTPTAVFISDVRFPNEVYFLQTNGGIYIDVDAGVDPVDAEEAEHSPRCRTMADAIVVNRFDETFKPTLESAVRNAIMRRGPCPITLALDRSGDVRSGSATEPS